jgi:hypothetical protein
MDLVDRLDHTALELLICNNKILISDHKIGNHNKILIGHKAISDKAIGNKAISNHQISDHKICNNNKTIDFWLEREVSYLEG